MRLAANLVVIQKPAECAPVETPVHMVDKVHVWRALAQTLPQTLPNILCRNAARLPPPRCLHNQGLVKFPSFSNRGTVSQTMANGGTLMGCRAWRVQSGIGVEEYLVKNYDVIVVIISSDTDPQKVPQVCPVLCAEYAAGNGQQGQLEGNLNKFHSERKPHMK